MYSGHSIVEILGPPSGVVGMLCQHEGGSASERVSPLSLLIHPTA
jgi:hypothetical protein